MQWDGGVSIPGKNGYEGVRFNVISVTRGWVVGWVSNFQEKSTPKNDKNNNHQIWSAFSLKIPKQVVITTLWQYFMSQTWAAGKFVLIWIITAVVESVAKPRPEDARTVVYTAIVGRATWTFGGGGSSCRQVHHNSQNVTSTRPVKFLK